MEKILLHNMSNKKKHQFYNENILDILDLSSIERSLLEGTKLTPLVWKANKKNNVKLLLNNDSWQWYANMDGRIVVWKKEVPEDIKDKWGLDKNTPDVVVKQYIFSHENNHHVLFYMFNNQHFFPSFAKLYNKLKTIREVTGKWLSQLWNMKDYTSHIRQTAHEEDLVELFNMYCINPDNLKKYLEFLVKWNSELIVQKNLYQIDQNFADRIYSTISECIAIFLEKNWIVDTLK